MQALKPFTPTLVGGAADLVESTKTEFEGAGVFSATHAGRNIAFGIREHAMGSIVNGIALEPAMLRPFGSTFLIFSDYMRPAVRLSALAGLPTAWVWTHDSIGVGEDGPTHQPVEHHMALRAIPNLWYVRPGDANETADGLAHRARARATARWRSRSAARSCPRSTAPRSLPPTARCAVRTPCGSRARGDPDLILLATGSEVHVALDAARTLDANVRVVSMPCWELFEAQPQAYRDEVLPPSVEARLSVEAGISLGWERWVGLRGASVAVDRFGASAPAGRIFEELGFTAANVADRARALLGAV